MLVLGLQGSPRKKGNTEFLLNLFLEQCQKQGAQTRLVQACQAQIEPCKELIVCEKKGYCPIEDDMSKEIYGLLRQADVVVAATPIFFYNTTAQLKALIDRTQTLWARKYRLKLNDANRPWRKGFALAVGATRGKNLFEGFHLTMQYFYDAVGATYDGSLTYREIEHRGDMARHPSVAEDVRQAVATLLEPFKNRRRVLFACRENACRSQMAAAFAQFQAGDRLDVGSCGSQPAAVINPLMVQVMQEKGLDLAFRTPRAWEEALAESPPELVISMGCDDNCPVLPGAQRQDWAVPDPAGADIAVMRQVRDEIESKVTQLLQEV